MSLIIKAPTLLVSESRNLATQINIGGTGYISIIDSSTIVLANILFNSTVPLGTPDSITGITTTSSILIGSGISTGIAATFKLYSGAANELFRGFVGANYIFTTDNSTNIFTVTGNNFTVGDEVLVSSNNTLPSPLLNNTSYFVISSGNSIQISSTIGGSTIVLTNNGTGIHKIRKNSSSLILNSGNTNPLQISSGQAISISSFSYNPEV